MGVRFPGEDIQLDRPQPAPVGKGQRQSVAALEAVERVGAFGQRMCEPEVVVRRLEGLGVRVGHPEEEAVATGFERLVEGEVLEEIQVALADRDLAPWILGPGAQDLHDRLVIPLPEGAHRRFVVVDDAVPEEGPNRCRRPVPDKSRVAQDGLVERLPAGPGRRVELAGHRVFEGVRREVGLGVGW